MSDQQKRVDFQAGGNLLDYMRFIKEEAKKIAKDSLTSAQQQSQSIREQIVLIKQRFDQEQRERNKIREQILSQDKLEMEKLKKQIDSGNLSAGYKAQLQKDLASRQTAFNDTKAGLEIGDKELFSILHDILDSLKEGSDKTIQSNNELMKELLDEQKKELDKQKTEEKASQPTAGRGGGGFKDYFNAIIGMENLKSFAGSARQALRTENGFDGVVPAAEMGGKIAGGGLGALIGGLIGSVVPGAGTLLGAGIGANLGSWLGGELSGGITEQMKRAYDTQIKVQSELFKRSALTGTAADNLGGSNMNLLNSIGMNMQDYYAGQGEISKRRGFADGGINATQVVGLQRALGVQTETTYQLIDIQRMSLDQNKDTFSTITGLLKAGEQRGLFPGGDRTFLGEFLSQFSMFSKQLGAVQTKIDDSLVAGLLFNFNSMGGQWGLRDPRAMGNITGLNEAIANPSSDIAKVIDYRILRRAMPGASLDKLNEEESKGVFSKYLLKGILQEYSNAPQGTVLTALRERFGGQMSFDAIRELYRNRNKIMYGNGDISKLLKTGGMSEEDVMKQASTFTTDPEKFLAQVNNGFALGAKEGVEKAIDALSKALEAVFNRSAVKVIIDKEGNFTVNAINPDPIVNKTWVPSKFKEQKTNGMITKTLQNGTLLPVFHK